MAKSAAMTAKAVAVSSAVRWGGVVSPGEFMEVGLLVALFCVSVVFGGFHCWLVER